MIFLDTSGLLAIVAPRERHHDHARSLFTSARHLLLHNYVLAESVPVARARGVPVSQMLDFLSDLLPNAGITTVWVDQQTHERAVALIRKRPDKEYSLCDAVSFVLMRDHGVSEALTTDRHFEQEGFVRLLKP